MTTVTPPEQFPRTPEERAAEAHYFELREKIRRELNWDEQEQRWQQQERHDRWQRWFWIGVVILGSLGLIFR